MHQGETKFVTIEVEDEETLKNCSIQWRMAKRSKEKPIITKITGDGIEVVTVDKEGETIWTNIFVVILDPEDTEKLPEGVYYHEAKLTDTEGNNSTTTTGWVTISPTVPESDAQ